MKFEDFVLEGLGLVVVGGLAFAVCSLIPITPYDYAYSKTQNKAIFCGIPVAIYLIYRIYFGLCFYITSLTPKSVRFLGNLFVLLF